GSRSTPPRLTALQSTLVLALAARGFAPDERSFAPHVTLARAIVRPAPRAPTTAIAWRVRELTLVRSETGTGRYAVMGRWPLGAASLFGGLRFAAFLLAVFFLALRAGRLFAAFFLDFLATRFLDERFLAARFFDDFFLDFLEVFFFAFFFAAMVKLLSMLTDCLSCSPPAGRSLRST